MPGLTQRDEHYTSGFWSKDVDGVSYNQLHKFWSELSPKARQELLRIDKQALFEQARKNMCCSRCHDLLLEGFSNIVSYGRSLQQEGSGASKNQINICTGELQDPAVHLWGGLTTTRDGSLTLLDCYLFAKSFKGLQTVFESACARESERELLYPDACGGGGPLRLSQGKGYSKGHGTRETCFFYTSRLSCDTLVDMWSALEEESRQSILRMKEEDFVERLTYRFDCKKSCRDCRRNVIREFKELKELKRMQREPRCTDWFCVADTAFQYEVDNDSVRADWSHYFTENAGYHHFEWAIGTGKGESDILEFKDVGNDRSVQVNGLDLCGLHECYITLRAFKKNGLSTEISVKAHALIDQPCVHTRLVVGDGFVSINRGECIRMAFEHAEEAEEEEDGECLHQQKHAKSPELAREFLLDAATVIFKEQVEKAFREGCARQNAHGIFVCLSLKLLEQRVHIACKEIVTLEKQKKLLEEEENEKREEEQRKERKRTKEREKKLRKKERLKEKEREKEQKNPKFSDKAMLPNMSKEEEGSPNLDEETNNTISCKESGIDNGDVDLSSPCSPGDQGGECLDGCTSPRAESCDSLDREIIALLQECLEAGGSPNSIRSHEEFQCSDNRTGERYDYPLCVQSGTLLNHSATPFLNSRPVPDFHPFADTNTMNTVDQAQTLEPLEQSFLREADDNRELNQMPPMETHSSGGPQTNSDENFSFFHFGGPAALSTRSTSNPAHSKDEILGNYLLQFSRDHVFGDPTGNSKKERENTVGEQYKLFGTSNNFLDCLASRRTE